MSDQPDKPEDGNPAADQPAAPEPDLVPADEVHLSDPAVSQDALEPTLNTSADDVRLSEPSLEAAEISPESAEAASLNEAAAEAESVAREAEDVGTLVGGPRPTEDPADAAAPAGTAPAGGTAGDVPDDPAGEPDATDTAGQDTADGDQPADGVRPAESASEEKDHPAALASFAASGDEPTWTGPREEQSRWDALFAAGQANAAAALGDTAAASGDPADTAAPSPARDGNGDPEGGEPSGMSGAPEAAPESPWAQPFQSPHPQAPGSPVPPVGGPYGLPPAGASEAAPTRIRARSVGRSSQGSSRRKLIILGVIGLVVVGLLILAVLGIMNALRSDDSGAGSSPNTTPGADGIIAENLSPLDLAAGDCILDFDAENVSAEVTTVTCTTPHNAQLLATTSFPDDAEFPGEAALNASGDDLCNSVSIDETAASEYAGLTLTQVTPTSGTWADGDRRIDCFVVSDEGNTITDNLLAG